MTYEEYKNKIKEIEAEANHRKKLLMKVYCDANNPYKVGDIVKDHIGSIQIESIAYDYGSSYSAPCCVYKGPVLKKDLTPVKRGEKRSCYQSNIILA